MCATWRIRNMGCLWCCRPQLEGICRCCQRVRVITVIICRSRLKTCCTKSASIRFIYIYTICINMTGQTPRALWLCFMHAAATFYIAHIFFINCKFRSDPRGIHELAVCSVPCPGTVGERGTAALMLQQLRLEGSVAVPSGQRTRSRRWRWRRQSVVKMNMRILAAEILNIRRVCRSANRAKRMWRDVA